MSKGITCDENKDKEQANTYYNKGKTILMLCKNIISPVFLMACELVDDV